MGELQTLLKEIPIPYITIVVSIIFIIFKGMALLQTSNVEKIFFSFEKNIFIRFSHVVIISIPITFLFSALLSHFLHIPLQQEKNFLIAYFTICFMFIFAITLQLYLIFFPDYLGKFAYYIEHEKYGKLYIIKSINRKEVLLYSHPRLYKDVGNSQHNKSLILEKEFIKKQLIYRENFTTSNFKFLKETLKYHGFYKQNALYFWYMLALYLK
ncbi:hypothetical protein E0M29_09780 [Bacillus cereus]|uniref:hypothetical protein n=1 Tax=Bacillus cereus TaxID=1396 RepID=UPI00103C799D|nr:hypothetical protein [Bacillus cereus]TBX90831.1 hypothetical protein E0M29_09780 [Bacillus cereus]